MRATLNVAKWGNSLAVRLPAEYVQAAGLCEGDSVQVLVGRTGEITLIPGRPFAKAGFLARLRRLRGRMPMTRPVVERMRREARY